ncbi:uncharacterized protein LOC124112717 isoform X2 [Haliotis rufescens]|uniref:uncharacterized protein LOC124112717 isoform X2 n=1 Tax=Haliotis rufescens TaxID=6454 RepID=UPI001EB01A18|nr:uncharacterized protein LOC124112717 isoform X2 [Haliotis rufescens]
MMAAFCVYAVILSLYLHARDADSRNESRCYGATLNLSCDNEVIALDNIYAIAKKLPSNCPPGGSAVSHTLAQSCCETFVNDCKINYTGLSVSDYHKACSGSSHCQKPAAWQTTESCGSDFLSPSTYMEIEYHCVESSTVRIPSNNMTNGTTVSIQNEVYPSSGPLGTADLCSVTASNSSAIAVSLLHLNITCQQHIDILDGSSCERIDCGHNTNYSSGTVYTSINHVIHVRVNLSDSGRFWIQFNALNSHASVELLCGLSAPPTAPSVSSCPDTSTTRVSATENLTTALPNVQENTDATTMIIDASSKPKQSTSPHGGMSLAAAAGTGIGVVVCVMLLPILLCVLYKKKHRLMKVGRLELADSLSITGTDMSTTAPSSSRLAPN